LLTLLLPATVACEAPTRMESSPYLSYHPSLPSLHSALADQEATTGEPRPLPADAEWFRPHNNRLQHGFTFDRPHHHSGPLAIDVALTGIDGIPHRTERGITWMNGRRVVATYDDLLAWDATGRDLPAHMQLRCDGPPSADACNVRLQVDDDGAHYPVTVDPFLTLGEFDGYSAVELGLVSNDYYIAGRQADASWVWQLVGDTPVFRGEIPIRRASHEVGAFDDRMVTRSDSDPARVWELDPVSGLFEPQAMLPVPPDPYGHTDIDIQAVAWAPDGLLAISGVTFGLGVQNLYLMDDSSGTWEVAASSETYDWGVLPSHGWSQIATSHDGIFHVSNYEGGYTQKGQLRSVVQNGPDLQVIGTIEENIGAAVSALSVMGGRIVWDAYGDYEVASDVTGTSTQPDIDGMWPDLSPSGDWMLNTLDVNRLQLFQVSDDLDLHLAEVIHPISGDPDGGIDGFFIGDDAHVIVSEYTSTTERAYVVKLTTPPFLVTNTASVDEGAILLLDLDAVSVDDADTDDADLTLQLVALPTYGDVLLDGVPQQPYDVIPYPDLLDGLVSYIHHGDESTQDQIELEACDPDGQCSAVGVLGVTIRPVNDPPLPVPDALTVLEGGSGSVDPLANDVDPDSLLDPATSSAQDGSWGTTTWDPTGLTYTHDGSETTSDTLPYTVCDVDGACASGSVAVTITPVNDPPLLPDAQLTVDEGAAAVLGLLALASDVDSDLDPTSASVVSAPGVGTAVAQPDGTVAYTHDGSETMSDAFDVALCDVDGACVTATVTVEVSPVNDPPIPGPDVLTVTEGGTGTVDLLANDTDVDSDLGAGSATVVTAPSQGTVSVAGAELSYTHDGSETTADSLVVEVCDGDGGCGSAEVQVTVTPVDDPPMAVADEATVEQGGTVLVDVLANDTDVDSETLTVLVVSSGEATAATVAAGQVNLVHDGSDRLEDSVALQVCDATTCVDSALAVTVTPSGSAGAPGANEGDAGEKDGCGCVSGGPAVGWMGLVGVLAGLRRRGVGGA